MCTHSAEGLSALHTCVRACLCGPYVVCTVVVHTCGPWLYRRLRPREHAGGRAVLRCAAAWYNPALAAWLAAAAQVPVAPLAAVTKLVAHSISNESFLTPTFPALRALSCDAADRGLKDISELVGHMQMHACTCTHARACMEGVFHSTGLAAACHRRCVWLGAHEHQPHSPVTPYQALHIARVNGGLEAEQQLMATRPEGAAWHGMAWPRLF